MCDMARLAALICRRYVRAFGARRSGTDRQICARLGPASLSGGRRYSPAVPVKQPADAVLGRHLWLKQWAACRAIASPSSLSVRAGRCR
jgi:hypothetical protein